MLDNQSLLDKYDAIVIGSGISGLTTALILAKEGKKIALLERDQDIAPLIRPYKRKGCEFSPGLHISGWMDEGETLDLFFKYLNISDGIEKKLHQNGVCDIIIGSNKYHIPRGFDNVERNLLSYFPDDAEAIGNYIRSVKAENEKSFYFNHKLTPKTNSQHQFKGSSNLTLESFLKQYHASADLIDLLGMMNYFLIGSKAEEVPFDIHAFVVGGFYRSPGLFTVNGINRILSNFKRELARFGVDLFFNSEVDEILIGDNRNVIGVKVRNGGQYFSSTVIASFNPKLLTKKVKLSKLRPAYRQRLNEAENTFGLYVAFYETKDCQDMEIDNFIYYNDSLDITLAATTNCSGENKVFCVFLMDNEKIIPTDIQERAKQAKEKLAILEKIFFDEQIPGLKGKTVLLDYLKPWSFERYTKTINGSAYGVKQTINSFGFQHRVPIKGLYLVGQAIYPGFLGSMLSGFNLAFEFLEPDSFWPGVIQP